MRKGFTLIELLVVIAIIALLSAIVISSLDTARDKGSTSAIEATMKQIAIQAALYRSTNPTYGGSVSTCSDGVFSDPVILSAQTEILTNAAVGAALSCFTDSAGAKYTISVSALKTGGSLCIDNSGNYGAETANSDGTCH